MMFGLGADATGGTNPPAVPLPGFTDGLKLWSSPSVAVTTLTAAIGNPSTAFSGPLAPFTFGMLAVPIGLLAVVGMAMSSSGGRH